MAEEAPKQEVFVTDVLEVEEKNATNSNSSSDDDSTNETYSSPKKEDDEVTSEVKFGGNYATEVSTENNNKELFPENEMKALAELKLLIKTALNNHEFSTGSPLPSSQPPVQQSEEVTDQTSDAEAVVEEVKKNPSSSEVNEDGIKTVEAVEESVVSVTAKQLQQTTPAETLQESSAEYSPSASENQKQTVKSIILDYETNSTTPPEEVSIWGVPLFKDQRTDTILWKFLRARDFKAPDAFAMFKSSIKWRREFEIDELVLADDLCKDLAKAVFMHGVSKEGHPVCYNVYGAFKDKQLYEKTFSDDEKRQKFLKWRIQLLEKSIRKLDFWGDGVSTIVQVNDLRNSPGPGKWELRQATKQALHLLQDNYPEFVAKQVFINVPWWYVAVNKMINAFLTQRTKSKFVVAGPSKSAETLFSYISPEQVPVQYGGFNKLEGEFGSKDCVSQIYVKPASKETVEFAVTEACHLTWEVRVLGWEVSYGAEFVPHARDAYTVIIQKMRKVGPTEDTIISNTFKTSESGKVVLTIDNSSSKKKRLLYRLKSHPSLH